MKRYTGLLYSQIGYDTHGPKRALIRGASGFLGNHGSFVLNTTEGAEACCGPLHFWGETWGSSWWIADFTSCAGSGTFVLDIIDNGKTIYTASPIHIGPDLLWEETFYAVGITQPERRQVFAKRFDGKNLGWFDAGMQWQEANSHAALLFGLSDIIEFRRPSLGSDYLERVCCQVISGCGYLAVLQDMAIEQGHGEGPLMHQAFARPGTDPPEALDKLILPADTAKAAAAWARASRVLPSEYENEKTAYRQRAHRALDWVLLHSTTPAMGLGFNPFPHAVDAAFQIPDNLSTPDLAMSLWAAIELEDHRVFSLARQLLTRQISEENGTNGIYGHFSLFESGEPVERAWFHGVAGEGYGFNCGNTMGQNMYPLISLIKRYPDHPDNILWNEVLRNYIYGYFIPGCQSNPFNLFPYGYYPGQGFLHFAGLWHGANAIYGNAAAIAEECAHIFNDPGLHDIAGANLQWIAGLNAGLTNESLKAAYVARREIADGIALPVSMIHGIGNDYAGSWMNIPGSICNGFSTGKQFEWDVLPRAEFDTPASFTDEEWITHAGGWLSGLARVG